MTPLPAALGGPGLVAWRLERERYLPTWQAAEGAFLAGGRWSSPGRRVLYAALDPATAILEVAVHKGFDVLDAVAHSLLELTVQSAGVHVVKPADVPNPHWLHPGVVSRNQQRFGDELLRQFGLVALPSVVSMHSWNLLVGLSEETDRLILKAHERFSLVPRLAVARG